MSRKIILAISDEKGKNALFVLDNLEIITREQIIQRIKSKEIFGIGLVKKGNEIYIRTLPNISKNDNLKEVLVSINTIEKKFLCKSRLLNKYSEVKSGALKEKENSGEKIIYSVIYLYQYIRNPIHSIYFAAAKIKQIIDLWSRCINVDSEVIGTLYSRGTKPCSEFDRNKIPERAKQIATEFYAISQQVLK